MSRIATIPIAAAILVVLLLAGIGYLAWSLNQTGAQLQATQAELAQTSDALKDTQEDLQETDADLEASVEHGEALTAANTALLMDKSALETVKASLEAETATLSKDLDETEAKAETLTADLTETRVERDALRTGLADATAQVADLTEKHSVLMEAHGVLTETNRVLTAKKGELEGTLATAQAAFTALEVKHGHLVTVAGDLEQATASVQALQAEIARLEAQRRPLILRDTDTETSPFACTGSMEPKLTCLDTATFLTDFDPADIVVGATIIFQSNACWSGEPVGSWTSHRVVDTRYSGGVYYFWPKGDANRSADSCWVPHAAVDSYIIAIHKNTVPENAELRNNVNAAKARRVAAYDAAIAHREAHGCYDLDTVCTFYTKASYNKAVRLRLAWEAARDYWRCWYDNALESEYPGHIPHTC